MVLGISITEKKVYVKVSGAENVRDIPFAICKLYDKSWEIGLNAYKISLANQGILIDRLLSKAELGNVVKVDNVEYKPYELLEFYFRVLFMFYDNIEFVTLSLSNNNINIINAFDTAMKLIFNDFNKYKITTNSDCFIRYIMNLDNINFNKSIGLIEFSDKLLEYYEINKQSIDYHQKDFLNVDIKKHPPVPLELLSNDTGVNVCDRLLTDFAKNVTLDKNYNLFLLTGEGFVEQDKYRDFINHICTLGCQVLKEDFLFAIGATLLSEDFLKNIKNYPYDFMTDNRTNVSLSIDTSMNQKITPLKILDYGEEWIKKSIKFQIIVYDTKDLVINIDRYKNSSLEWNINLSEVFDIRPNKTLKLGVKITFPQRNILSINIYDSGFGDFYEASDKKITMEKEI